MAIVMPEGLDKRSYTIGGIRCFINRMNTDGYYEGYRDIGNVIEAPFAPVMELKEHFSADSGARVKDYQISQMVSEDIKLKFDMITFNNLRNMMYGDIYSASGTTKKRAYSTGNTITNEVHQFWETDAVIIGAFNPASIVVKDITGATTYSLTDDYLVETVRGGYKQIRRVAAGDIANGAFIKVSYTYEKRVAHQFAPGSIVVMEGKVILCGVSKSGAEWCKTMSNCQITPDGDFSYASSDYTQAGLLIKNLDNSSADASYPFGLFEYFGIGSEIWKGTSQA